MTSYDRGKMDDQRPNMIGIPPARILAAPVLTSDGARADSWMLLWGYPHVGKRVVSAMICPDMPRLQLYFCDNVIAGARIPKYETYATFPLTAEEIAYFTSLIPQEGRGHG